MAMHLPHSWADETQPTTRLEKMFVFYFNLTQHFLICY